ncbi:MAG: crossover junction endodeoxyribonuclease RuvC [Bacteroidota bacterium]
MKTERIILGIDPGTLILGYGIIKCSGNAVQLICMDVLRLNKLTDQPIKLKKIFDTIVNIIDEHHPDELAIEAPFFGKNPQSMLKLGRAQGVAIAAALHRTLPVFEYSPRKIKQSVTGNGNASKEQVAAMLIKLLNLKTEPTSFDATDSVAAAMCHYFQRTDTTGTKSYSSWKGFLSDNPGRKK